MDIKNANSEQGVTLIELLIGLAILCVVVLALAAILHTSYQSNQMILTDMNQIKEARKAIDAIMDEIHYSRGMVTPSNTSSIRSISYTDFNGIANTVLAYNTATRVLTVTRGAAGKPITIVNGNILRDFTITQATDETNTYIFTMTFRYNPNDSTKDLTVTTRVKPFTYQ